MCSVIPSRVTVPIEGCVSLVNKVLCLCVVGQEDHQGQLLLRGGEPGHPGAGQPQQVHTGNIVSLRRGEH